MYGKKFIIKRIRNPLKDKKETKLKLLKEQMQQSCLLSLHISNINSIDKTICKAPKRSHKHNPIPNLTKLRKTFGSTGILQVNTPENFKNSYRYKVHTLLLPKLFLYWFFVLRSQAPNNTSPCPKARPIGKPFQNHLNRWWEIVPQWKDIPCVHQESLKSIPLKIRWFTV